MKEGGMKVCIGAELFKAHPTGKVLLNPIFDQTVAITQKYALPLEIDPLAHIVVIVVAVVVDEVIFVIVVIFCCCCFFTA